MEILERFEMVDSNAVNNPIVPGFKLSKDGSGAAVDLTYFKQIIGSLMYLTATRPDLMISVSLIIRYMEKPTELHLQAVKRVIRYLKGTVDLGIAYIRGRAGSLVGYIDNDYAGDIDDRNSKSGFVFMLAIGAVSWSSKKQPVVTLSTTEAKLIAAAYCACQAIWMRRILEENWKYARTGYCCFM